MISKFKNPDGNILKVRQRARLQESVRIVGVQSILSAVLQFKEEEKSFIEICQYLLVLRAPTSETVEVSWQMHVLEHPESMKKRQT